MNATAAGPDEEQFLLYELSLSIGQSIDPQTTCRDFLSILASRQYIDAASI